MKSTRTTAEPAKPTIAEHKKPATISASKGKEATHLFDKENYKWMLIGLVVIAIGFILMAGGKSSNPNVFNEKEVYSLEELLWRQY